MIENVISKEFADFMINKGASYHAFKDDPEGILSIADHNEEMVYLKVCEGKYILCRYKRYIRMNERHFTGW